VTGEPVAAADAGSIVVEHADRAEPDDGADTTDSTGAAGATDPIAEAGPTHPAGATEAAAASTFTEPGRTDPAGGAAALDGRAQIGHLADDLLPALIARLSASSLGELEIREGAWRVRLRRAVAAPESVREPGSRGRRRTDPGGAAHADATDQTTTAANPSVRAAASTTTSRDGGRIEATSPAVGYYAPRDGLAIGQQVRSGDVLGHIDVLGVRQEVVAPLDGLLVRHLAESGEAVEYGQPLVRLERLNRSGARLIGDADVVAVSIGAAPVVAPGANGSGPADGSDLRIARPANGATPDVAPR
jgi:acetyl-CoA carboxylase biotin carboxyl carrier protein